MDTEGNVTNTKHQRSRLLDVELATAEINLAKAREQVMAIDDHKMIVSHLIMETKARVMTIGARAAPKVLNQKSRAAIKKVIDSEAIDTLIAMSKVELPLPAQAVFADPPAEAAEKKPRARAKKKAAKKSAKKKTSRSSKPPAT
jgi:Holliday junction resolvasome RuvABC DNA-binding subunit